MPKKPQRDNRAPRELRTVHTAGERAASLLQRISRHAGVVLQPPQGPSPDGAPSGWLPRLQAALPEELRPQLTQVIEKSDGLVLFVRSAAWASRLKLLLPELDRVAEHRRLTVRLDPAAKGHLPRNT